MAIPLQEKYRPRRLKDLVGNTALITKLKGYVKISRLPPLSIFGGPAGVGKTSAALAFANDYMISKKILDDNLTPIRGFAPPMKVMRGSVKKDQIQGEVTRFMQNLPAVENSVNILLFDEADGMTPDSLLELRPLVERFGKNVAIIFTTNLDPEQWLNRSFDPRIRALFDRAVVMTFEPIPDKTIVDKLREIAKLEGISISTEELVGIAQRAEGSLRSALKFLSDAQAQMIGEMVEVEEKEIVAPPAKLLDPGKPASAVIKRFVALGGITYQLYNDGTVKYAPFAEGRGPAGEEEFIPIPADDKLLLDNAERLFGEQRKKLGLPSLRPAEVQAPAIPKSQVEQIKLVVGWPVVNKLPIVIMVPETQKRLTVEYDERTDRYTLWQGTNIFGTRLGDMDTAELKEFLQDGGVQILAFYTPDRYELEKKDRDRARGKKPVKAVGEIIEETAPGSEERMKALEARNKETIGLIFKWLDGNNPVIVELNGATHSIEPPAPKTGTIHIRRFKGPHGPVEKSFQKDKEGAHNLARYLVHNSVVLKERIVMAEYKNLPKSTEQREQEAVKEGRPVSEREPIAEPFRGNLIAFEGTSYLVDSKHTDAEVHKAVDELRAAGINANPGWTMKTLAPGERIWDLQELVSEITRVAGGKPPAPGTKVSPTAPPVKPITSDEIKQMRVFFDSEIALRNLDKKKFDPVFDYYMTQWKNLPLDRVKHRITILIDSIAESIKEQKVIPEVEVHRRVRTAEQKFRKNDVVTYKEQMRRVVDIREDEMGRRFQYKLEGIEEWVEEVDLKRAEIPAARFRIGQNVKFKAKGWVVEDHVYDIGDKTWRYRLKSVLPFM